MRVLVFMLLLGGGICQLTAGGENSGIPLAPLPVPFDKCSVSAANDADMRLTAVAWGYNNEFWVAKQGENWGAFGEWYSIGGFFAGGPTVVRNANNDLVVFGKGADRKVWYKVLNGVESDWTSLGGKLLSGRVTAVVDPQGLIHIFARAKDSAVWEKRQYANGTEAVWGDWTSLGGVVSSGVAAVVDAEGIIHLFARGVDGWLWSMTQKLEDDGSLTWVSWQRSEGSAFLASTATITARLNAQNLVEVIVRAADKSFWHFRQTVTEQGVSWSQWKSLGGIFASAPTLQLSSDSLLTVFGRGPEKGAWYKQQAHHPVDSSTDSWTEWISLGGRFSASIDSHPDSRGYISVFGRGLDKSIWTRSQIYVNHTVGFFGAWSDLGGRFRSFSC
eukprot:c12672_g1_i1.p1 GENE.c12672_g1_i1~~c12672_g1_i1.p1  ORF type:complete len:388 (+),score=77.55 c12672_g1_i1:45-1208(+)